jgi:hypothetical protein
MRIRCLLRAIPLVVGSLLTLPVDAQQDTSTNGQIPATAVYQSQAATASQPAMALRAAVDKQTDASNAATPSSTGTTQTPNTTAADRNTAWTPNPANMLQGGQTDEILTAPSAVCSDSFDKGLDNPTIGVQQGFEVSGAKASHSGRCEITITLTADKSAMLGPLRLTINDQTGKLLLVSQMLQSLLSCKGRFHQVLALK